MEKIAQKLKEFTIGGLMLMSVACTPMAGKQTNLDVINDMMVSKQAEHPVTAKRQNAFIPTTPTAGFTDYEASNPLSEKMTSSNGSPNFTIVDDVITFGSTINFADGKGASKPVLPKSLAVSVNVDNNTGLNVVNLMPSFNTRLPLKGQNITSDFVKAVFPAEVAVGTVYNSKGTGEFMYSYHAAWDMSHLPKNFATEYILPEKVRLSLNEFGTATRVEATWNKSADEKGFTAKFVKAVLPSMIAADAVLVGKVNKYQFSYGWNTSSLPRNFVTNHVLPQTISVATNTLGQITRVEGIYDNSVKKTDSTCTKVLKHLAPDSIVVEKNPIKKYKMDVSFYNYIHVPF